MYYSVIGAIAIVLHLIMNHEFIKIDKNRDEINKAYKKFVLASLMYFVTDVLRVLLRILLTMVLTSLVLINILSYLRMFLRILVVLSI